jgi:hypothetical protein
MRALVHDPGAPHRLRLGEAADPRALLGRRVRGKAVLEVTG